MTNKTFILLALIALFSSTAYSQGFLGFPRKLQDLTEPILTTSAPPAEENLIDDLLFGGNEEEMSFEEGEFYNEEGGFSNEEGEFVYSEEEMIFVDNEIPNIPALSDIIDDEMLGDIWINASEEEMSFEEGEFSNEEGEFLNSEEEMILVGQTNDEIPDVPAFSDLVDDEMFDDIWIGASEEEMSFEEGELHYGSEEEMNFGEEAVLGNGEGDISSDPAFSGVVDDEMLNEPWIGANEEEMNFEGEFINEEGELALGEGEFNNEEAEFSFSDLGFGI